MIRRHPWLLVCGLVLLNALIRNAATPLWDQDEAAYAGFARHMLQTGDWVVPDFMWSSAHRKPPLLLWGIAASFKAFGESEFAARLPTTLATLAAFLALWWLGRTAFGERRARMAAVVLATSLFLPNMGKVALPDCWLLLSETVAPLSLLLAIEQPSWRWTFLFWGAVALGVLAKGPPILILAGGLFVWAAMFHPLRRNLWRLHPWAGLPLALLPFAAWGYLAWERTDGALIRWMFEWYIVRRARGGIVFGQIGPPGYHFAVMFIGLLPWSIFLPASLSHLRARWREPGGRFLIGWLLFGWWVWELMPSKLPAYAIGAYPAVAMLIAGEIEQFDLPAWRTARIRVTSWVTGILGTAAAVAATFAAVRLQLGAIAIMSTAVILLIAFSCSGWIRQCVRRGSLKEIAPGLAVTGLACSFVFWSGVMPAIDPLRGLGRTIADQVDRTAGPDATVVFAGNFHLPSLPFYVGRTHPKQVELPNGLLDPAQPQCVFILPADVYRPIASRFGQKVAEVAGWDLDHHRTVTYVVAGSASPLVGATHE